MNNEKYWDSELKIDTIGRDDIKANEYNYPYEPTPYCVLDRLVDSGFITSENTVLDYGCGKGRVDLYLAYKVGCKSIGIEYDERIYVKALDNKQSSICGKNVEFVCENAQKYNVPKEVDTVYFFNPFSLEILPKVIRMILDSYYDNPRRIQLFFYYPSVEYISYLMGIDEIMFVDEIDCKDLFDNNDEREMIIIFEIGY